MCLVLNNSLHFVFVDCHRFTRTFLLFWNLNFFLIHGMDMHSFILYCHCFELMFILLIHDDDDGYGKNYSIACHHQISNRLNYNQRNNIKSQWTQHQTRKYRKKILRFFIYFLIIIELTNICMKRRRKKLL